MFFKRKHWDIWGIIEVSIKSRHILVLFLASKLNPKLRLQGSLLAVNWGPALTAQCFYTFLADLQRQF